MESRVKFSTTGKQAPRIVDTSVKAVPVDPALVRKAFRARSVGSTAGLDLFSLREAMTRMLSSNGGRPGIEAASAQVKIPKIEEDWAKIERIARSASSLPHKPSITQTAAVILHMALSHFSIAEIEAEIRKETR